MEGLGLDGILVAFSRYQPVELERELAETRNFARPGGVSYVSFDAASGGDRFVILDDEGGVRGQGKLVTCLGGFGSEGCFELSRERRSPRAR